MRKKGDPPTYDRSQPTEAKQDPSFQHDALAVTAGLKIVLHREPKPHHRRLLEALHVDWVVDLNQPCSKTCGCPENRLDRRKG